MENSGKEDNQITNPETDALPAEVDPVSQVQASIENQDEERPNKEKQPKKKGTWWILGGILGMILIIFLGGFIGYRNGINKRLKQEETIKLSRAAEQYELGVVDLEQGRYQLAKERFEYVINLKPNYPGAADQLKEVMLKIYTLATPTGIATATLSIPTASPTPDYRDEEELFDSIIQMIIAEEWHEAITAMDLLRQKSLEYRPVDVDGLYYIALRNRGVEKILTEGSLEPGIYDLSLAERFAPLDGEADGYRTWARLYLTGASYWDINWEQVVYYFSQVQPAFPYLRDGSGMTATDRYRIGLLKYGDQLALSGEWCKAKEYYDLSFTLGDDVSIHPTATYIYEQCAKPQEPTSPPPEPTQVNTPVPTGMPTEGTPEPTPITTPTP